MKYERERGRGRGILRRMGQGGEHEILRRKRGRRGRKNKVGKGEGKWASHMKEEGAVRWRARNLKEERGGGGGGEEKISTVGREGMEERMQGMGG